MTAHFKILELVTEQCEEAPKSHSLIESLGVLRLHFHRLESELSLSADEQDAEQLLQEMVGLAATAVAAGATYILPAIDKEDR